MASPIQFYRNFQALMQQHGIRHVLTSGMACVEYGIQQNTKDTDWIIHPDDLVMLVAMLCECERGLTGCNWVVSYRPLFGAPFLQDYHQGGWTSHLFIYDAPDSPEHHLDFFGHPPRVQLSEVFADSTMHLAKPLIVAQMKKTDRDKDWPMVESLSWYAGSDWDALLHLRSPEKLQEMWTDCPKDLKPALVKRRPLLRELEIGELKLAKCLAVERMLWEQVNKQRYRRYQTEWKDFLRRWKTETDHAWPVATSFPQQQQLLCEATAVHQLPPNPLGGAVERQILIEQAWQAVAEVFDNQQDLIQRLTPPMDELLP
jgi:hypothetical protein